MTPDRSTYAAAGVDIAAGDRAVELIREHARSTSRPEVLGGIGAFAAAFAPRLDGYTEPVLLSATDGVGTKLAIAQTMDRHDTVGIDCVAMVVNDLACHGAEPIFFLDYISCGRLIPERIERIVAGIAEGCRRAGCALVGGETAEHPGVMDADEYDLAGFAVGIAERDRMLGPDRVRPGDALVGIASTGLHSNGFSLVRKLILDHDLDLAGTVPELGETLGAALLRPTRIYSPALADVARSVEVRAAAHITGGGITGNVPRALPAGARAVIDAGAWPMPPIFRWLQSIGDIADDEMRRTFNLGIGMVVVVAGTSTGDAIAVIEEHGGGAFHIGAVEPGDRDVTFAG